MYVVVDRKKLQYDDATRGRRENTTCKMRVLGEGRDADSKV